MLQQRVPSRGRERLLQPYPEQGQKNTKGLLYDAVSSKAMKIKAGRDMFFLLFT
jgi:hypothetical protein